MYFRNLFTAIISIVLLISCGKVKQDELLPTDKTDKRLELIGEYKLKVPEPSGLMISQTGNELWTVSDQNSTIYKLNITGEILDSIKITGDDFEGITIGTGDCLTVIMERERSVLQLDSKFNITKKNSLPLTGKLNKGIEGISFDPDRKRYFIVNEKEPGKLLVLDSLFNITEQYELTFAKDYSALFYDSQGKFLWVLSDESRLMVKCKPNGEVVDQFRIDIPQMEGLAIDLSKSLVYIVSDITEKLYVLRMKN